MIIPDKIWATPFDEGMEGGTYCNAEIRPLAPNKDAWCYVRSDLVQKWQPIETAPKDGTEILAWQKGEGTFVVFWYSRTSTWKWTTHDLDGDENLYPSYWMPLPAPPVTEGEN